MGVTKLCLLRDLKTFTIITAWSRFGQQIESILGMNRAELEQDYSEYQTRVQAATVNDYMWSLFNKMLLESSGDFHAQGMLYFSMYYFLEFYEERNGKQFKKLSLESYINKAREKHETSNYEMELVVSPDHECSHAMSMKGKRFPLGMDLVSELLSDKCERDFCRCIISGMSKRDANDTPIRKKGH